MKINAPKWTGLKELDEQLKALGTAVSTEIASDAVTASAELLAAEWRRVAPFDPNRKPKRTRTKSGESVAKDYGHLRTNIRVRRLKPRRFSEVATIVSTGDAFWARFYEFGTVKQPPRPVFRTAIKRLSGQLKEEQAKVFYAGIEARARGAVLPNGRNG